MSIDKVWVLAEIAGGNPITTSLELLTHARSMGGTVEAVTWGPDAAKAAGELGNFGATKVYDVGDIGDALPGPAVHEPPLVVISTEELQSLVFSLGSGLSPLEADALRLYLEGASYEDMAEELGCDTKTIDNALQRVKRKILSHQKGREVLL